MLTQSSYIAFKMFNREGRVSTLLQSSSSAGWHPVQEDLQCFENQERSGFRVKAAVPKNRVALKLQIQSPAAFPDCCESMNELNPNSQANNALRRLHI